MGKGERQEGDTTIDGTEGQVDAGACQGIVYSKGTVGVASYVIVCRSRRKVDGAGDGGRRDWGGREGRRWSL